MNLIAASITRVSSFLCLDQHQHQHLAALRCVALRCVRRQFALLRADSSNSNNQLRQNFASRRQTKSVNKNTLSAPQFSIRHKPAAPSLPATIVALLRNNGGVNFKHSRAYLLHLSAVACLSERMFRLRHSFVVA